MASSCKSSKVWSTMRAFLGRGISCCSVNTCEVETVNLLLGKLKGGHAFLSLSRELLQAYSAYENSAEIISVQNSWLSQQSQAPEALQDAGAEDASDDDDSSNVSEDELPPLERNMSHLFLQESDDESEYTGELIWIEDGKTQQS